VHLPCNLTRESTGYSTTSPLIGWVLGRMGNVACYAKVYVVFGKV
jgi:hypothetical protein